MASFASKTIETVDPGRSFGIALTAIALLSIGMIGTAIYAVITTF